MVASRSVLTASIDSRVKRSLKIVTAEETECLIALCILIEYVYIKNLSNLSRRNYLQIFFLSPYRIFKHAGRHIL